MSATETDYLADARQNRGGELARVEHRSLILELRRDGLSTSQISTRLAEHSPPIEMTPDGVRRVIGRYLEHVHKHDAESVAELRALENERLDDLWNHWVEAARANNPKAAQILLRISERRAKMNGLDAAAKMEHFGSIQHLHELGVDPQEIARTEQAFRATFSEHGLDDPDVIDVVPEENDAALPAQT